MLHSPTPPALHFSPWHDSCLGSWTEPERTPAFRLFPSIRTLLKHSAPYLIVTAVAALAALFAQDAITTAGQAAKVAGSSSLALGQARQSVAFLWMASALPSLMGIWSYYRAQSLSGLPLAGLGAVLVLLTMEIVGSLGFETEQLLALMSSRL